jgi:hypothetical protein
VNAFVRAGRSPFSQRGEEAESGRMTQARVEALVPPLLEPEQPVSSRADAEMTTATEIHEDVFISLPFWYEENTPWCPRSTMSSGVLSIYPIQAVRQILRSQFHNLFQG